MVSFIVPVYNACPYIEACVKSLTDQGSVEVLLIDDGSTDGSEVILQRMPSVSANGSQIRVLRQDHAGQSAARNKGLSIAQGEYLVFVDADDRIAPDWLERHMQAIEGADYVQSGYQRIYTQAGAGKARKHVPFHRYQFTSPCMRLYRREAIEGMRFTEGMIYEDVIWSVELWLRRLRCRMIDYAGYLYTFNPAGTTSRPHPEAQKRLFSELRRRLNNADLRGKGILLYTILRLKIHFLMQ